MHAFGGLYLDIDVECFLPTDELLAGRDVVLQLEDANPKSLNNAVMASVPGHPFWVEVMQIMEDRGSSANDCFLGYRDLGTVLKTTGVLHVLCSSCSVSVPRDNLWLTVYGTLHAVYTVYAARQAQQFIASCKQTFPPCMPVVAICIPTPQLILFKTIKGHMHWQCSRTHADEDAGHNNCPLDSLLTIPLLGQQ